MKNIFSFILFFCLSLQLTAQITIERSDYTRMVNQPFDSWNINLPQITLPTEGADQTWDYSNIQLTTEFTITSGESDHPDFPTANLARSLQSLTLGFIPQTTTFHSILDEDEFSTLGRTIPGIVVNLEFLTGNNMDELEILIEQ